LLAAQVLAKSMMLRSFALHMSKMMKILLSLVAMEL